MVQPISLKMEQRPRPLGQEGFSIVEGIVTAGLLFVIVSTLTFYITRMTASRKLMSDREGCHGFVSSLIDAVKVHDNSLTVRSWLPTDGIPGQRQMSAPISGITDPFCQQGRVFLCDTIDHWYEMPSGGLNPQGYFTGQNIRGAASWALSLHNHYPKNVCQGMTYPKAQLAEFGRLFPNPIQMPDWVEAATLRIEPLTQGGSGGFVASCPGTAIAARPNGTVQFRVSVDLQIKGKDRSDSCRAVTQVSYAADGTPPQLKTSDPASATVVVRNGKGERIDNRPGKCTCTKEFKPGDPNNLPAYNCDTEMRTLTADLISNEPGSIFLCHKTKPSDTGEGYCGKIGLMTVSQGARMNMPTTASMSMSALSDGDYAVAVYTIDTAGNRSPSSMAMDFNVKKATCPPMDTYCPGDSKDDGCGGKCPIGSKSCGPFPPPNDPGEPGCTGEPCLDCQEMGFVDPDRGDTECVPSCTGPSGCPAPFSWGCNNCWQRTEQNKPNLRTRWNLPQKPNCCGDKPRYCFEPASCPGL